MRIFAPIIALMLTLGLARVSAATIDALPYGTLAWSDDMPAPTALGLSRRAQAYIFIDMHATKSIHDLYEAFRQYFGITYQSIYGLQVILVCNDGLPPRKSGTQAEYWAKASDPHSIFLHSLFGTDAVAGLVLVDKAGAIVLVQRFNQDNFKNKGRACEAQRKMMEALAKAAEPLVDGSRPFPSICDQALGLIRMGDIPDALTSAANAGKPGKDLLTQLHENGDRIIIADTQLVDDATQPAGLRLRAELRLADEMSEGSNSKVRYAATTALHHAAHDRSLLAEQQAWKQLQDFFMAMDNVNPKDVMTIQRDLLPQITAKYPTTYAADVVKLITKACRL